MSNYNTLKNSIRQVVKQNGNNEITGPNLQTTLVGMVNSIGGGGYIFAGLAEPTDNPGAPDQRVFYLTVTPGTYTHFGGLVVEQGELAILRWDSAWRKSSLPISAASGVTSLNDLGGAIRIRPGTNIAISKSGQDIIISASGGASGVTSLNELAGALQLVAGDNIIITKSGNNIILSSSGGGGMAGKKPVFVVCARRIPKENFGRSRTIRFTNSPTIRFDIYTGSDPTIIPYHDTIVSETSTDYVIFAPVWNYILRNNYVIPKWPSSSIEVEGTENLRVSKAWLAAKNQSQKPNYILAQGYCKMTRTETSLRNYNAFVNDGGGIIRPTIIDDINTSSPNLVVRGGIPKCISAANGSLENDGKLNIINGRHIAKMRRTGWADHFARKHPGGKRRIKWRFIHISPQAGATYHYTGKKYFIAGKYWPDQISGYFLRVSAKFRLYRVVRKRISENYKEFWWRKA